MYIIAIQILNNETLLIIKGIPIKPLDYRRVYPCFSIILYNVTFCQHIILQCYKQNVDFLFQFRHLVTIINILSTYLNKVLFLVWNFQYFLLYLIDKCHQNINNLRNQTQVGLQARMRSNNVWFWAQTCIRALMCKTCLILKG